MNDELMLQAELSVLEAELALASMKANPYHDPRDGKFSTRAGGAAYGWLSPEQRTARLPKAKREAAGAGQGQPPARSKKPAQIQDPFGGGKNKAARIAHAAQKYNLPEYSANHYTLKKVVGPDGKLKTRPKFNELARHVLDIDKNNGYGFGFTPDEANIVAQKIRDKDSIRGTSVQAYFFMRDQLRFQQANSGK